MSLSVLGANISQVEILNISNNGIWIFIGDKEYFLDYQNYPWFKNATVNSIFNVEFNNGYHLYWPDLDIDLDLNDIINQKNTPLIFK